jgi:hypothetical protein
MSQIGIVTNLQSRGLALDASLLFAHLSDQGHDVTLMQYDAPHSEAQDLLIFCEVVVPGLVSLSRNPPWLFVNPEFLFEYNFKTIRTLFGKVLCKTREAHRICGKHFGSKAFYTGFMSQDVFRGAIARENRFLHVAGSSRIKNTLACIDAWRWKHHGKLLNAKLTVVADWLEGDELPPLPDNVTVLNKISDEEMAVLQNLHRYHLQPSGTEGWSHVLHEALGVGALIITTDAPPMNELSSVYTVPSVGKSYFNEAEVHEVSAIDIYTAVEEVQTCSGRFFSPRQEFLRGNAEFKERFAEHLETVAPHSHGFRARFDREFPGQLRVAFLGNFRHTFCTESDLAYELEHMGHDVVRIQEDIATLAELQSSIIDADVFLWVHTHSFNSIPEEHLFSFLELLANRKIPSVSFHLDRFFSIPERESRIGVDPFWKTEFVFSADGGHQIEFLEKGVNHFWLPPAVVSRGVHGGFPRTDLRCDVAFVGSVDGYHDCYPFRSELVRFLQDRYRVRFKLFQGVREAQLNDVYASSSVVAGDSIFANDRHSDRYFSDRVPETMGRGGVLVHAEVKGLDWPGLTTHRPGDLGHMAQKIDWLLANPVERRRLRDVGMRFVKEHHTYKHRIETILKTIGLT